MNYCPICNNRYTRPEEIKEVSITFTSDGKILTAFAKRVTDAFYEITKGQYRGNWVHIWDILIS
jgi:hypothetical protein